MAAEWLSVRLNSEDSVYVKINLKFIRVPPIVLLISFAGGLVALRQGRFDEEFQRYKYQRIEWAK